MKATKKILVLTPLTEHQKKYLQTKAFGYCLEYASDSTVTPNQAAEAEIIIGNLPLSLLGECRSLQWMQLHSAGANGYTGEALPKDVLLTSASGAYDLSVAEHLFGMLLAVYKRLFAYWGNQKEEIWQDMGQVKTLQGQTVLLVGLGNIGLRFASMVGAFGAHVIGVKRRVTTRPPGVEEVYPMEDLLALAKRADVVVSLLPDTEKTRGIYGKAFFDNMKKEAVFINGGRGTAVCQGALIQALWDGAIAAAILDVTEPEPLPPGHPLWNCPNLYITPHVAGGFHLEETTEEIVRIAGKNLENYLAGKPLYNLVDREEGY